MKNEKGIELVEGMKVKGHISCQRSYGRFWDKEIEGTLVIHGGRLKVNSISEPEKNYPLLKFAHNSLTEPNIIHLDII